MLAGFEDEILQFAWIGKIVGAELTVATAGGLHFKGAVVKEGSDDTAHVDVDVLQFLEAEATNVATEEATLIDRNDASIGNRPDIEVVIKKGVGEGHPDEEEPGEIEKNEVTRVGGDIEGDARTGVLTNQSYEPAENRE